MKIRCFFLLLLVALYTLPLIAQVELPALISDNMVLQQQSDVNLWGKSKPNTKVNIKCSWTEKEYSTTSNVKGEWLLEVKTPKAGGPYQIEISDGIPVLLKNILIGEVWICSGQSNMEMPIQGFKNQPTFGAKEAIFRSRGKNDIRMFTLKTKASEKLEVDCMGQWNIQTPSNVMRTSAIAYYFAERITESLGVPVGIIVTAWGGSSILAWMPEASIIDVVSKQRMDEIHFSRIKTQNTPAHLYNAMINPLIRYKSKGFLWYQGEENLSIPKEYKALQAKLVTTWRQKWGDEENSMPFYFVQIAPHSYGASNSNKTNRPLFVESQKESLKLIPNSKMATTTDLGSKVCIHPAEKREIADRIALLALSNTYSMDGYEAEFPQIESIEYKEGKAIIKFKNSTGVSSKNGTYGDLITGFELAGADKIFYSADAYTEYSDQRALVIESPNVVTPIAVRYAFRNYIDANLVNNIGIASPSFRSDDWSDND